MESAKTGLSLSLFVRLDIENVATPPKKAYFRKRNFFLLLFFLFFSFFFFAVVLLWCCYDSQTDTRLVEDQPRDFINCIVDYNMCAVAFNFVLKS